MFFTTTSCPELVRGMISAVRSGVPVDPHRMSARSSTGKTSSVTRPEASIEVQGFATKLVNITQSRGVCDRFKWVEVIFN